MTGRAPIVYPSVIQVLKLTDSPMTRMLREEETSSPTLQPSTKSPTTPSDILLEHLQVNELINKDRLEVVVDISLHPTEVFKSKGITAINFLNDSWTLPSSIQTFNSYCIKDTGVVIHKNRDCPVINTTPLDILLKNETRCISTMKLSLVNHEFQILKGGFQLLRGQCGPCFISLKYSRLYELGNHLPLKSVFKFLNSIGYQSVFGEGFKPRPGAVGDNYYFVRFDLKRCKNMKLLYPDLRNNVK